MKKIKAPVTNWRLRRTDFYRPQVQLSKNAKMSWSSLYGFLAARYPERAAKLRDQFGDAIVTITNAEMTMMLAEPLLKEEFELWVRDTHCQEVESQLRQLLTTHFPHMHFRIECWAEPDQEPNTPEPDDQPDLL